LPQKEKRWHAKEAWPKKKGVAMSQKKGGKMIKEREREPMFEGVSHTSIDPHTCTSLIEIA